ncbi:MAG: hypothetical protein ACJ8LI_05420 [Chthoniobacterales bacterium]
MRRLAAAVLLALLVPGIAAAKKLHCTLRAHAEGSANDGEAFSTQMVSPSTGRPVVIEKIPTISEHDVVAFKPYPARNGTFGVIFLLDDHGKLALDTLSIEHRGRFLYIFVNGRPTAELQIDRRVSDGKLYVASGLTSADIELMKKDWPIIGAKKK